jgi:imidazolonepropionase-like amidohydrolase
MPSAGFSAATALDQLRAGATLQSIADAHTMDELVAAVRDALTGLRLGISSLDEVGLRRVAGLELWSIAEIAGHGLRMDEAAHQVALSLAVGQPPRVRVPYAVPGPADATRDELLAGVRSAEERLAATRVLAAGGPAFAHEELGELTARAWVLFSGVHLAAHLHQAAAVMRAR